MYATVPSTFRDIQKSVKSMVYATEPSTFRDIQKSVESVIQTLLKHQTFKSHAFATEVD